ncbi:hypothetical protein [uncultured Sphingomonas sp.]|uniref:hypothetical protein n=1 Tax=uncultured Sphingomonas sp. TaxID=158754 RepID=UPI0037496967
MVAEAIDAAEQEFEWCLKVLAPLGGYAANSDFAEAVPRFQLRLLDAITALEQVYRRVKQEEKRVISRKPDLDQRWFRQRMVKLAFYTKALAHVLAIGRSIGDGFAWFFYESHRELIEEHRKHQRQPLLPPRIGALGERLTLQNMLVIDGKLMLYHGITTFLRIGDFTLIDLKTFEVAAIGELKSSRPDDEHVQTEVSLVSVNPKLLPRIQATKPAEKMPARMSITPAMADRLKRQKKVMFEALEAAAKDREKAAPAKLSEFHFGALEDIVRRCDTRKFEWVKAGPGFVIGAVRIGPSHKRQLSTTLLNNAGANAAELAVDAPDWAMKIVCDDRRLNSMMIGTLFGEEGDMIAPRGSFPVSLWPLSPEVLADLLLQRVMVITLLNPAHLWIALEAKGYELVTDREGRVTGAKMIEGDLLTELSSLEHYTRMIASFMMTEASILALIEQLMASARGKFDGRPMKVELDMKIKRFPDLRKTRNLNR